MKLTPSLNMTLTDGDLVSSKLRRHIEKLLEEMEIKNYTMDISAGTIPGDNYLGVVAKVVIKGEEKSGKSTTLNLIVKSAPKNEAFRTFTSISLAYDREIYMYAKVLPEFTKLQKEKGIVNNFRSFAKYYNSTMEDLDEAIIMENMKELGFVLHDRHTPLDYNHVLLVMKEYGKLHALSYALRDQKPELFKELSENAQEVLFKKMDFTEATVKSIREQSERALASLDPVKHKVAYNKFKNYQNNMIDVVVDIVQAEPAGKYGVIGHGDCWINNILYKYEDSTNPKSPSEICFLDWQLSHVGSPVLDLSYFIFTSTDKELRDKHYDHLIQEYYNSLSSFLRELGSDPEKMLPYKVLQEHLKKFSVFGLYMSMSLLQLMTSEVDEIPDVHNSTSIDNVMEKFNYKSQNVEKYHERIRPVILDFVKFGYDF